MKNHTRISRIVRNYYIVVMVIGIIPGLVGCTAAPEQVAASVTPIIVEVTATPLPTSTPLPPTDTPTPTATPDRTATVAAAATAEMVAKMIKIAPQLEKLGFDLDSGELLYTNPSIITLTVDSYMEDKPKVIIDQPVKDFVMRADIIWTSTSGLAGCGIVFRAEEDFKRGANYQYLMLRLSGAPAWDIEYFRYGQFQYSLLPAAQFTAAIDERQSATNTITLIVQGDKIESMINTTASMDASDKKLAEGQIALLAWQESGKTNCSFKNVWVWGLKTE